MVRKMYIEKFLLLRERKVVNDMYKKSFNISTVKENVSAVENIVERYGNLSELNMITKAPNLIKLNAIGGAIDVPYGWNQDRLSFILSVVVPESPTKNSYYFITGYTDFYEETLQSKFAPTKSLEQLNPDMKFQINSITLIEELISSVDGKRHYKYIDEITLIKNSASNSYDQFLNQDYLIRPMDIMSKMSDYNIGVNLTSEATEVAKNNINPISYMSRLVDIIVDGSRVNDDIAAPDDIKISNNIKNMLTIAENKEPAMMNCPFLLSLYQLGDTNDTKPSWFTIPTLLRIFGSDNVNAVTKLILFQNEMDKSLKQNITKAHNISNILDSDNLANTLQPTLENLIATEFYYIISSLMFNRKITKCMFIVSNHRGFHTENIAKALAPSSLFHDMFASIDTARYIDTYIKNLVLPKLSNGLKLSININADIDILGKSSIAITIESGDSMVFRFNSAMDNNFTPIVTTAEGINNITDEVHVLVDSLYNKI